MVDNFKTTHKMNMIEQELYIKHASGDYPIKVGCGLLTQAQLQSVCQSSQVCIVTDKQVADLYLDQLVAALDTVNQIDSVVLPHGEAHKTFDSYIAILNTLADKQHHRDTTLIALGGGVVGDMTGFAAATYHRGVNFIQVPTTLLAQVDASIGGKTAINHPQGKNLVGAFYQPKAVLIDLETLTSLPDREYVAGVAEIIKAALIRDKAFVSWLEDHMSALLARDLAVLQQAVVRACEIKRDVVIADEKESMSQGIRALLNFGHTFGHALEHELGYGQWLHGEAVGLGMLMATYLSQQLGLIDQADYKRVYQLITQAGLPTACPQGVTTEKLMQRMMSDKKVYNGKLNLIVLDDIGVAHMDGSVPMTALQACIDHYIKR